MADYRRGMCFARGREEIYRAEGQGRWVHWRAGNANLLIGNSIISAELALGAPRESLRSLSGRAIGRPTHQSPIRGLRPGLCSCGPSGLTGFLHPCQNRSAESAKEQSPGRAIASPGSGCSYLLLTTALKGRSIDRLSNEFWRANGPPCLACSVRFLGYPNPGRFSRPAGCLFPNAGEPWTFSEWMDDNRRNALSPPDTADNHDP
jgi:hypothetical protein